MSDQTKNPAGANRQGLRKLAGEARAHITTALPLLLLIVALIVHAARELGGAA
ncbi:hypothetical protein [Thermomonas paludicola]|uniref:hypothetical protein n=1 Tax=Thermomonas paludicola TaxID=2884874 RepID=UPI002113BAB5|nr:hypothetical protein [Thermomonas paludicola]